MKYRIYNEDAVEWAKNYQKGKFHALLTDAPYHLTSIVKRYQKIDISKNTVTNDITLGGKNQFGRLTKGFMNQSWDGGDIAFRPETWASFKEVLYPGAFGMAFSASRNWHRMAVAIEDAGFIIHPTMFFLWVQGQGFPKATNISKQLDKQQGIKGEVDRVWTGGQRSGGIMGKNNGTQSREILAAASEDAKIWEGHRYGLQALKPSVEPIIVFQKPYEGKPLDNIVSTGAGALNIDGGRVGVGELISGGGNGKASHGGRYGSGETKGERPRVEPHSDGRWPANLILDEGSAERLDAQSGVSARVDNRTKGKAGTGMFLSQSEDETNRPVDLGGGASRFFYQVSTQLDETDPFLYEAKAKVSEREDGLLGQVPCSKANEPNVFHDVDPMFSEKHYTINDKGEQVWSECRRCNHPTVKPIGLAQHLATLLLPPAEYGPRRIMVPFSGVGSEMVGCGLAGWEHVVGVEFDTENGYVDIAQKRLEYWLNK